MSLALGQVQIPQLHRLKNLFPIVCWWIGKAVILLAYTQIHKYTMDSFSSVRRFFTFATIFCVFVSSKTQFCCWIHRYTLCSLCCHRHHRCLFFCRWLCCLYVYTATASVSAVAAPPLLFLLLLHHRFCFQCHCHHNFRHCSYHWQKAC